MRKLFLRRYTDLPALICLLREKKITLLDPYSWDDSNDSHYLSVYKSRKGLKTLLALCFTQVAETYHHWRVFAAGSSGVCIKFKRTDLIKAVDKCGGVRTGEVEYLKLEEARSRKPTIDQLPFIKRHAFEDEDEFRVIFESSKSDLPKKDIPIPLSCISKITLSPWAHQSLTKHVKEVLKGISGCKNIEIVRSTLVGNNEWKRIGGYIRRKN
jgi:hypothetical protein